MPRTRAACLTAILAPRGLIEAEDGTLRHEWRLGSAGKKTWKGTVPVRWEPRFWLMVFTKKRKGRLGPMVQVSDDFFEALWRRCGALNRLIVDRLQQFAFRFRA